MARILSLTIALSLVVSSGYFLLEPQLMKAAADTVTITQNVTSEITISDCTNFTMSASIPGMTGGSATGQCTWTVTTNDTAGFNLTLAASTSPALQSGSYSFADYTPAVAGTPDYSWTIAAGASEFGYTVEPATAADTVQKFLDDASSTCNIAAGSNGIDTCWYNLATAAETAINRSSETGSSGEAEVIKFQAAVSTTNGYQEEGAYTATVTATATTN